MSLDYLVKNMLDRYMNQWRGYVNLQVSQGRQILNKIKGGTHFVYITDSPTHVCTNIMKLVLLREREMLQ